MNVLPPPALSPVWSCAGCGGGSLLSGNYSLGLVLLSLLIAVAAAYTALELVRRVSRASGIVQRIVLCGGAAMMGVGIWSMHFVGMLAVRMPMEMSYAPGLTLLSMGAAVLGSGAALFVVSRRHVSAPRLLAGGAFMGLAITGMHYLGMEAMRTEGTLRYHPGYAAAALLIAIGASVGALGTGLWRKQEGPPWSGKRLGSALFMGAAIAGMHYVGMAGTTLVPEDMPPGYALSGLRIDELGAAAIGAVTLVWMGLTLMALLVEMEHRRIHGTLALLADASALLGRSLDQATLAQTLAGLVAPALGDGCLVDLCEEDGVTLRRMAVCYPGQREQEAPYRDVHYPRDAVSDSPAQRVLRTGQAELLTGLTSARWEQLAQTPESLGLPRDAKARSLLIVPVRHRDRVLGLLITFTRSRPLEETDRALLQELGGRAGSAVENARLYHEAQEAIRVRDEFLSMASHELNTPLTPLMMNLQRLQRTVAPAASGVQPLTDEQLTRVVDVAQRQTRRLARLVQELLDISRIRLGRLELRTERVDLGEVVHEVVRRLKDEPAWAAGGPAVCVEGHVEGQWDRARVEQVVDNLLANAARYGQGGPVDVTVRAHENEAWVEVRDRGIGIAPEQLQRIFERFERAASRNYGGLGLGLYIVRQIVEAHGGTIGVESALGTGSTFTVRLPLLPSH